MSARGTAAPRGVLSQRLNDRSGLLAGILLAFLMLVGGGGSPAPLAELACELLAAIVAIAWLWENPHAVSQDNRTLHWLVLLVVAVPMAQLIPLPPTLWRALPGRETMAAALDLIGRGGEWHAVSIAPHRTLASLLSLGPPLLMLVLAARLGSRPAARLAQIVAAIAVLAVVVGAGQLAQRTGGPLDFYATGEAGTLHGFQANRNTAADVLLIGLVALAAVWRARRDVHTGAGDAVFVVLGLILLLGVVLTGSRTGIAMAPLALAFVVAIVEPSVRLARSTWRALLAGVTAISGALALAAFALRDNAILGRVIARFGLSGEFRPELWRDTWFAIRGFWPVGSGLGTFIPAFLPAERLEVVDATLPHRAHNELLELALEGGIVLLLCWAVLAFIVLRAWLRAWGVRDPATRPLLLLAAAIVTVGGLHSLVDYPLRSMAMAALVAMGAGLAIGAASRAAGPRPSTDDA